MANQKKAENKKQMSRKDKRASDWANARRKPMKPPFDRSKQSKDNSTKKEREASEIADSAVEESKGNPFSPWYDKYPIFTKDAGDIGFSLPLGQSVDDAGNIFVPGVMRLTFYPTIGYSADNSSPINRSTKRFYTYLRTVMKSANRYDPADVMMHNMAVDSAYMFLAMMKRAYRVANLFSPLNKYYPRVLLQMMGCDPDSFTADPAELRAYINRYALQLQAYVTPKEFEITSRHMWMCEGLYLDANNSRAQTYMFVPEGFWIFNNTVATGSQLDWVGWIGTGANGETNDLWQLATAMDLGNRLLNAIVGDEDTGNISGDMVLVYGEEGVRRAEVLEDNSIILPVYDELVLSQIENAHILGAFSPDYTPVITQDPTVNNGAILFTPSFVGNQSSVTGPDGTKYYADPLWLHTDKFMNIHGDNPTPEQVIEASRFMVSCDKQTTVSNTAAQPIKPTSFGADVICSTAIAEFRRNAQGVQVMNMLQNRSNCIYAGAYESSQAAYLSLQYLALSSTFDWSPMLYLWDIKGAGDNIKDTGITFFAGDVDNIMPISYKKLDMMHEAAMLSLLDVPGFKG